MHDAGVVHGHDGVEGPPAGIHIGEGVVVGDVVGTGPVGEQTEEDGGNFLTGDVGIWLDRALGGARHIGDVALLVQLGGGIFLLGAVVVVIIIVVVIIRTAAAVSIPLGVQDDIFVHDDGVACVIPGSAAIGPGVPANKGVVGAVEAHAAPAPDGSDVTLVIGVYLVLSASAVGVVGEGVGVCFLFHIYGLGIISADGCFGVIIIDIHIVD